MKNLRLFLFLVAILALPLIGQAASDDKAWIITQVAKPTECISKVAIHKIDGREQRLPPQGFELEPGKHTLTGTVMLDTRYLPGTRGPTGVTASSRWKRSSRPARNTTWDWTTAPTTAQTGHW